MFSFDLCGAFSWSTAIIISDDVAGESPGNSPATSSLFHVIIEDEVATETSSFNIALAYCYAFFFVFSIAFPKTAESTMEFIHR